MANPTQTLLPSDLWADVLAVRAQRPLVHSITNLVVMNFNANVLLAMGASPVMAHAHEEVTDMARNVKGEVISSTFDEPADRQVVQVEQDLGAVGAEADRVGSDVLRLQCGANRAQNTGLALSVVAGHDGPGRRERGVEVFDTSVALDSKAIDLHGAPFLMATVTSMGLTQPSAPRMHSRTQAMQRCVSSATAILRLRVERATWTYSCGAPGGGTPAPYDVELHTSHPPSPPRLMCM